MPDVKITELPSTSELHGADQIIVEQSDGTKRAELGVLPSILTAGTGIDITNSVITNTIFNASLNQKSGIDLNTITEGGVYYVQNGSPALNFPSGTSGALVVIKDSGAYSRQIYYRHGTLNSTDQYWYSRLVNSSTQEASDWVKFYNSKTLISGTGIRITNDDISNTFTTLNGTNLNTLTYNFRGLVLNATNYPTGVNANGVVDSIFSAGAGSTTPSHGTQIYRPYLSNDMYVRLYNTNNQTWGAWNRLAFAYKAGDTVTISTPSTAPVCMGGYIGSNGTALNLTFSFGREISATSVSATTLRISAYNATGRLLAASATNDLITGSVYSCTLTLNVETSTVTVHIVKNDGTTFGTNGTSISGALSGGTFVFS